jgi:hypothetical protein
VVWQGRAGDRSPYADFLVGAILSSMALILMPRSSALWMAAGLLWVLDACINISMEPFRAFVADLLPEFQRTRGGISSGSFYGLKNRAAKTLGQDQLTRISLLIGIYKALNILYSQKLADAWIALPNTNPMFGGDSPLIYAKRGGIPAFLRVRQLLDARRGGR